MPLPIVSHPEPRQGRSEPRFTFAEMRERHLSIWKLSALDEMRDGPLHYLRTVHGHAVGWGRPDGVTHHTDMTIGALMIQGFAVLSEDLAGRPIIMITEKGRRALMPASPQAAGAIRS